MNNLTMAMSFGAGLLSFFSPCVLPVLTSFFVFLSAGDSSFLEGGKNGQRFLFSKRHFRLIKTALFFILGFSCVFAILGVLFSTIFVLAGDALRIINIASGIIVILFGLQILFNFIPILNYEKRPPWIKNSGKFLSSFLVGAAFGAGWTPCIGPILASILLFAAQEADISRSVAYLISYSAGFAIPFFLAASLCGIFFRLTDKLKVRQNLIKKISGILILLMGVLILTGDFQAINSFFQRFQ